MGGSAGMGLILIRDLVGHLPALVRPRARPPGIPVDRRGRKQDQSTQTKGDEAKDDQLATLHPRLPAAPSMVRPTSGRNVRFEDGAWVSGSTMRLNSGADLRLARAEVQSRPSER